VQYKKQSNYYGWPIKVRLLPYGWPIKVRQIIMGGLLKFAYPEFGLFDLVVTEAQPLLDYSG
jgi:hypothetical protein